MDSYNDASIKNYIMYHSQYDFARYCCLGTSSEPLIMPQSAQMDDNKD